MPFSKDRLLRDNIFIWFGTYDEDLINNALILAGGDILILMGIQKIELNKNQIKNDLLNMTIQGFIDKYNLLDFESIEKTLKEKEINKENYKRKVFLLIEELKDGVRTGIYPPFNANYEKTVEDFKNIINNYLGRISNSLKPEDSINHLDDIINECEERKQMIKKEQLGEDFSVPEKVKKVSKLQKFNELLEIQKEIDDKAYRLKNKIRESIKKFEDFKRQLS